ncbi:hypothetical protein OG921_00670 [Aldersonia sp. NBC_00410]|uniref:hypothetical protein n=1 Tax=Aldersonia sp. NBC_00410 TaxID=2975954 RepID=UPI00224ECD99|nr:hypothetical protein [Aldersonia sp. NBC_00410]MCX5041702.1 hypothetical protein [Aldersonia sp. NBC_00410]
MLDLPRVPWEGGPDFYRQFPRAQDWTNPNFFPIGIWFDGFSSPEEVKWDWDHGITFYDGGEWEGTDFGLLAANGDHGSMYWVGDRVNASNDEHPNLWPGWLIDDEPDGTHGEDYHAGYDYLTQRVATSPDAAGRFHWVNYTQQVMGPYMPVADQEKFVNDYGDINSIDQYWYTIPVCDGKGSNGYEGNDFAMPIPQQTCRSASSYGKTLDALRLRDAADGEQHMHWQIIENLNGMMGDHVRYITPAELKGAAINSLIHEARGISWFNQSYTGDCHATNVIRSAQTNENWCGDTQIEAMGEVNSQIKALAPMLNTQSYQWTFGDRLDTMLKVKDGTAYIFAMTDGSTGERTFTLPAGLTGDITDESGRTLAAADGRFSDTFETESEYHIYRISLA